MRLPALCRSCGFVFPSVIDVDHVTNMRVSNSTSGPCPLCGGVGDIFGEPFSVINGSLTVLSDPQRRTLGDYLRSKADARTWDEVVSGASEEFADTIKLLLPPPPGTPIGRWIGYLLAVLAILAISSVTDAAADRLIGEDHAPPQVVVVQQPAPPPTPDTP